MGDRISFSNPEIERAIADYRFVALIEVTNGITKPQKRQEKKKQVKRGKEILKNAFGEEVRVSGGLALIKNTQKLIRELDFVIEIPTYNLERLYWVVEALSQSSSLQEVDRFYLKHFLNQPQRLVETLNPPSYLGRSESKEYRDRLGRIKGTVLEHYVKQLLEQSLDANHRFAIGTEITNQMTKPEQQVSTDILLACPASAFEDCLEDMVERCSGRQKIRVYQSPLKISGHKEVVIRPPYSRSLPF